MLSRSPLVRAYIGLGSNLFSPLKQVRQAIAELAQLPESRLCAASPIYCSRPMGPADQPDFINAVVAIDTSLGPLVLLDGLQAIENSHHRKRGAVQWGPRTLDLDLLLYGNTRIDESRLTVPHPGMHEFYPRGKSPAHPSTAPHRWWSCRCREMDQVQCRLDGMMPDDPLWKVSAAVT